MQTNKRVIAATRRATHINTLLCNVGLHLDVLIPLDDPTGGDMIWAIDIYDDGALVGHHNVYAHERSAVRAAWRLYREAIGE
jgi:hypothetical protein